MSIDNFVEEIVPEIKSKFENFGVKKALPKMVEVGSKLLQYLLLLKLYVYAYF